MPWSSSALVAALALAACMTPRHEVFVPAAALPGWDTLPAEGTGTFAQRGTVLRVRLTEDENACLQAVVSFTIAQGELTIDFSAVRAIAGNARLAPVRIERRPIAASLGLQPPPLEKIGPVQTIRPGTPWIAMGGLYLLTFAAPARKADTVTIEFQPLGINGRRIAVPPVVFVRQGVSRSNRKSCS